MNYRVIDENGNVIEEYETLAEAQDKLLTDIFCYWHIEDSKDKNKDKSNE